MSMTTSVSDPPELPTEERPTISLLDLEGKSKKEVPLLRGPPSQGLYTPKITAPCQNRETKGTYREISPRSRDLIRLFRTCSFTELLKRFREKGCVFFRKYPRLIGFRTYSPGSRGREFQV